MIFVQDDEMIQTLSPERSNDSFGDEVVGYKNSLAPNLLFFRRFLSKHLSVNGGLYRGGAGFALLAGAIAVEEDHSKFIFAGVWLEGPLIEGCLPGVFRTSVFGWIG